MDELVFHLKTKDKQVPATNLTLSMIILEYRPKPIILFLPVP